MTRIRKLLEVFLSIAFVFGITVIGFRVEEPFLGLLGAIIVWLYFQADFSK